MEEVAELVNFLPFSFRTLKEQKCTGFLWDAFATKYMHVKYQFAFLATQQAIVAKSGASKPWLSPNCELIACFKKKIQITLTRVWGEETSAVSEAVP